jgi:hypothetical protein
VITSGHKPKSGYANLDEAVEYLMQAKKISRRTARRLLMKALADGELEATGVTPEGRRERIPPEECFVENVKGWSK